MTPQDKLKWRILSAISHIDDDPDTEFLEKFKALKLPEQLDEAWNLAQEWDGWQDLREDFRNQGTRTELQTPWSRHYDCEMHVVQCPDGTWVAFPYWYGGGKHGEPQAIEWITADEIREVSMREETRVVRVFEELK